ncbi:hypothetical protein, partial [Acidithiobacillus ferridurans]|uniref:hypothetical protein n=1 Tax=Acidithiobacillus ferridurans TaxID=1232575 RepID=UPI001C06A482
YSVNIKITKIITTDANTLLENLPNKRDFIPAQRLLKRITSTPYDCTEKMPNRSWQPSTNRLR